VTDDHGLTGFGLLVAGLGACGPDDSDSDEGASDSGSASARGGRDEPVPKRPTSTPSARASSAWTRHSRPRRTTRPSSRPTWPTRWCRSPSRLGTTYPGTWPSRSAWCSRPSTRWPRPETSRPSTTPSSWRPRPRSTRPWPAPAAVDYGYQGVPATLEAGPTVFVIDNQSAAGESHEIGVARIADGVTETAEQILALPEEEAGTHPHRQHRRPGGHGRAALHRGDVGRVHRVL